MDKLSDNLKKIFLAGIGAVAVTAEKSKDLLDKMTPEQIAALKEQILKKEEASETAPDEA